jgi:hypothetical protein
LGFLPLCVPAFAEFSVAGFLLSLTVISDMMLSFPSFPAAMAIKTGSGGDPSRARAGIQIKIRSGAEIPKPHIDDIGGSGQSLADLDQPELGAVAVQHLGCMDERFPSPARAARLSLIHINV